MIQHLLSELHVVWSADRFYWAVLDASMLPRSLGRSRHDRQRLGYLFEAQLPLPIEQVQAVYLPLGESQYLACGVEHARLENEVPGSALTLRPDRVPIPMENRDAVEVESINLLVDRHEPAAVRSEVRRFLRDGVVLAILFMVAIGLGITRRSGALDTAVADMALMRAGLYEQLYDPTVAPPSTQPPTVRLLAELRQLRRTRTGNNPDQDFQESESSQSLQALLANWPRQHLMRTESISITPSSITLSGILPSAESAQAFATALASPTGWEAKQPQVSTMSDGVRLTLRLTRQHSDKPNGGSSALPGGGNP